MEGKREMYMEKREISQRGVYVTKTHGTRPMSLCLSIRQDPCVCATYIPLLRAMWLTSLSRDISLYVSQGHMALKRGINVAKTHGPL